MSLGAHKPDCQTLVSVDSQPGIIVIRESLSSTPFSISSSICLFITMVQLWPIFALPQHIALLTAHLISTYSPPFISLQSSMMETCNGMLSNNMRFQEDVVLLYCQHKCILYDSKSHLIRCFFCFYIYIH